MRHIKYEKFQSTLRILCIQQSYHNKENPASVDQIIFPNCRNKDGIKELLQYFIQEKKTNKNTKLAEYVNFIREERDKLFPNNYNKKPRKFISHFTYKRASLLSQYAKEHEFDFYMNLIQKYPFPISFKNKDIDGSEYPIVIANYYKDGYFYDIRDKKYDEKGYEISSKQDIQNFLKD